MTSSVSSLTLVGLSQEMIVALELPLNVAAIILSCILSMLLSVFNALGPTGARQYFPDTLKKVLHGGH